MVNVGAAALQPLEGFQEGTEWACPVRFLKTV